MRRLFTYKTSEKAGIYLKTNPFEANTTSLQDADNVLSSPEVFGQEESNQPSDHV